MLQIQNLKFCCSKCIAMEYFIKKGTNLYNFIELTQKRLNSVENSEQ